MDCSVACSRYCPCAGGWTRTYGAPWRIDQGPGEANEIHTMRCLTASRPDLRACRASLVEGLE
jgi:hypothetical protein